MQMFRGGIHTASDNSISGNPGGMHGPDSSLGSVRPVGVRGVPVLARPSFFKKGGKVKKTGWAKVHKGETVVPAKHEGTRRIMSSGKKKTKKRSSQKRVSTKIKVLRNEGVKQDQAVATAINMEKKHRLTNSGGYKRVKK